MLSVILAFLARDRSRVIRKSEIGIATDAIISLRHPPWLLDRDKTPGRRGNRHGVLDTALLIGAE